MTATAPTQSPASTTRFWLIMAAVIVLVVLIVGGSGGDGPAYDPRSVNPDGAKGIVETLERLGATVDLDSAVPQPDSTTALMLRDRLTVEDDDRLRQWVSNGGVLVVADLSNELAVGINGIGSSNFERGVCTIEALAGVTRLEGRGSSLDATGHESCFGDGNRAFVVAERLGAGTVVTLGTPDVFTNAFLDEEDNAVLAAALLAPRPADARVTFVGPSIVEFGEEGLLDLVPNRVWNAIWQLMAAFLLYALYRARRLGGVVAEPVPVHIEGSELVLKAGVLSQRAKDPASAAVLLRNDVIVRARSALSADPAVTDQILAERIASRTRLDLDAVAATLLAPVETEADLVRVADELAEIDTRLYEPQSDPAKSDTPLDEKVSP